MNEPSDATRLIIQERVMMMGMRNTVSIPMKRLHVSIKPQFNCSICKTVMRSHQEYNRHMALHDPPEPKVRRKFKCGICSREYTRKCSLMRHRCIAREEVEDEEDGDYQPDM